jgi:hypothetical protein
MAETKKKMTKDEENKLHVELVRQLVTLSTSGFGLVAALAWNNVVRDFVDGYVKRFLPDGSGIFYLLIYALVVTILAVLVTYQLTKLLKKLESK